MLLADLFGCGPAVSSNSISSCCWWTPEVDSRDSRLHLELDFEPSRLTNSTSVPSPNVNFWASTYLNLNCPSCHLALLFPFLHLQFINDQQQQQSIPNFYTSPIWLDSFQSYLLQTPLATCSVTAKPGTPTSPRSRNLDPSPRYLPLGTTTARNCCSSNTFQGL